jgi:hypothetical protein
VATKASRYIAVLIAGVILGATPVAYGEISTRWTHRSGNVICAVDSKLQGVGSCLNVKGWGTVVSTYNVAIINPAGKFVYYKKLR